jgi:hypothetical protein
MESFVELLELKAEHIIDSQTLIGLVKNDTPPGRVERLGTSVDRYYIACR